MIVINSVLDDEYFAGQTFLWAGIFKTLLKIFIIVIDKIKFLKRFNTNEQILV